MKKSILLLVIFTITLFSSLEIKAQTFPKIDSSPMDAASYPNNWREAKKLVKIIYGRPQLKGRTLDKLAPNGKVWRTGANEAAEITFYKDVNFGGKDVKAGTYTFFTIPNDNKWTIILSNQKNVWGSYFYDEKQDVVRLEGKVSSLENSEEHFSIVFEESKENKENVIMYMAWGKTVVAVPIKA